MKLVFSKNKIRLRTIITILNKIQYVLCYTMCEKIVQLTFCIFEMGICVSVDISCL